MNKLLWSRPCSCFTKRNMCAPPSGPTPRPPSGDRPPRPNISQIYKPTNFQKFILVWTKKYKSKNEIPEYISADLIEKSRSQARIKIANVLMLLTALASFGAILAGKAAAKRGESVHQMNMDWHKQYQEDYEKKIKAQNK